MKIRQAKESDLVLAAVLMKQTHDAHVRAYPHRYNPISVDAAESFLRTERNEEAEVIVATESGILSGFAVFAFVDVPASPVLKARRYCYLRQINVDPAARGRGVGRALIEKVRETARKAGIGEIELDVWAFNDDARRFFEKTGFEKFAAKMRISF